MHACKPSDVLPESTEPKRRLQRYRLFEANRLASFKSLTTIFELSFLNVSVRCFFRIILGNVPGGHETGGSFRNMAFPAFLSLSIALGAIGVSFQASNIGQSDRFDLACHWFLIVENCICFIHRLFEYGACPSCDETFPVPEIRR